MSLYDYQLPTVDAEDGWWTLHSPDPYDFIAYSPPVPVDPGQLLEITAHHYADVAVVAGFKLLLWLGPTENNTRPGKPGCITYTVGVDDLETSEATTTGTKTVPWTDVEFVRVAFEVDTCTTSVVDVTADVYDLSLHWLTS